MSCSLDQQGPLMLCVTVLERRKRRTQHTWAVTSDRQMGKECIKDILAPRQHSISSHSHYHLASFSLSPVPEYQWAPEKLVWPPLLLSALWVYKSIAKCIARHHSTRNAAMNAITMTLAMVPRLHTTGGSSGRTCTYIHCICLRKESETLYSIVIYPYSLTFKCMPTHAYII